MSWFSKLAALQLPTAWRVRMLLTLVATIALITLAGGMWRVLDHPLQRVVVLGAQSDGEREG